MSTLPAAGYLENAARTNAEMKVALEALRDIMAESVGGEAGAELTIASGAVTPAEGVGGGIFRLDTEGNAASDTLDTITQTNTRDGQVIALRAENVARVVTVNHAAGGTGQILLYDATDFVFASASAVLFLRRSGTDWVELHRFVPTEDLTALTTIATDDLLQVWDESAGTVKKITPPNLITASLGGACALLETETASASATLDFALDLTNYARHVIHIDNLKPATDGVEFWGRLSSDGVTYATTGYRWSRHNLTDAASEGLAGSTSDAKLLMANAVGNQDGEQISGTIEITSAGGMGVRVSWRLSGENASGSYYMINGMGVSVAAAYTYFRLMFSSGNISSGTARMYAFKK
jgi:hypothetical protein